MQTIAIDSQNLMTIFDNINFDSEIPSSDLAFFSELESQAENIIESQKYESFDTENEQHSFELKLLKQIYELFEKNYNENINKKLFEIYTAIIKNSIIEKEKLLKTEKKHFETIFNDFLEIQTIFRNIGFSEAKSFLEDAPYFLQIKTNKASYEESDLFIVSYTDKSDFSNNVVREANNLTLSTESFNVVHYNGPVDYTNIELEFDNQEIDIKTDTTEYNNDTGIGKIKINESLQNMFITKYTEGTILKVYWSGDKWNVATSKGFNAFSVFYIKNKSFGYYLVKYLRYNKMNLEQFYSKHDKNECYTYLLRIPELHNIINQSKYIQMKLISRVSLTNGNYYINYDKNDIVQKGIENSLNFLTEKFINNPDYILPLNENYIVCAKYTNGKKVTTFKYKLTSPYYSKYRFLSNGSNTNDTYTRFIQLRNSGVELVQLGHFSEENYELYKKFSKSYTDIIETVYNYYYMRFICRNKEVSIPKKYYDVIGVIQKEYNEQRKKTPKFVMKKEDVKFIFDTILTDNQVCELLN